MENAAPIGYTHINEKKRVFRAKTGDEDICTYILFKIYVEIFTI